MPETKDLLSQVQIAVPRNASWEALRGDERVQFCGQCKLYVYNLLALTKEEAEKLIAEKEGKLCARIYRRSDGTIITENCPRGLRSIKHRFKVIAELLACISSWLVTASRAHAQFFVTKKAAQSNSIVITAEPPIFTTTLFRFAKPSIKS